VFSEVGAHTNFALQNFRFTSTQTACFGNV
jgi:hypothetical protein